jgi:ParB/RepB/Spo0J family partition protein
MSDESITFKHLPMSQIERDQHQPRRFYPVDVDKDGDKNQPLNRRLKLSIQEIGIQNPLAVKEIEPNRYLLLDGHRRHMCAEELKIEAVPCIIYKNISKGQFLRIRFELQNNRRPWAPLERAEALNQIKETLKFKNNQELAKYLELSKTVVSNSLQLRKEKVTNLQMMEQYGLNESFQTEFVRLTPKLRMIKELQPDVIIPRILEKVQHKVIKNAKDFRRLGWAFLRATANEDALYEFFTNPDMTVQELEEKTVRSSSSLNIEKVIQDVTKKINKGIKFAEQAEYTFLVQLRDLLVQVL